MPENKESKLDRILVVGGSALIIDNIIFPFFTRKSFHEHLGLPPASDYQIWGERTVSMAENAIAYSLILLGQRKEIYNIIRDVFR